MGTGYARTTFERLHAIADEVMKTLTLTELKCLIKAISHADFNAGTSHIAVEEYAKAAGTDERNVQRALASLAQRGVLPVTSAGGGRTKAAVRTIRVARVARSGELKTPVEVTGVMNAETPVKTTVVNEETPVEITTVSTTKTPVTFDKNPGNFCPKTPVETTTPIDKRIDPGIDKTHHGSGAPSATEADPPKTPSPYRQFTDHFFAAVQIADGIKPRWTARDGKAASELWKALDQDLAVAKAVIDAYVSDRSDFFEGHPIPKLLSQLDKFRARAAQKGKNGNAKHGVTATRPGEFPAINKSIPLFGGTVPVRT
jgi:hypothetical protein